MIEMTEYYEKMLQKGLEFQDYVTELLYQSGLPVVAYQSREKQFKGENLAGVEIKFDDRLDDTGNIYIEVAEKTRKENLNYVPSGIYREDNSWLYAIGNYRVIYVFSKKRLQSAHKQKNNNNQPKFKHVEANTKTSKGFLIPETFAVKKADKILRPKQELVKVN